MKSGNNHTARTARTMVMRGMMMVVVLLTASGAETVHFSGTVTDENSRPVAGAEVYLYVRGSLRTVTDTDGRFDIAGDAGAAAAEGGRRRSTGSGVNGVVTGTPAVISLYDVRGVRIRERNIGASCGSCGIITLPVDGLAPGLYFVTVNNGRSATIVKRVVSGSRSCSAARCAVVGRSGASAGRLSAADASEFSDILVVTAAGLQPVRRAVTGREESDITVKMMSLGVGYVTPGIPVFTDKGGEGDVTTYGSVSDPEFSQGGACNYGSTGIRYYAAINVNQIPGDGNGQWQGGRSCGRCARVRIRTVDGEVRTTVVRIMDKCSDDNCGIDLGGAPAGEIMKSQPGRYSGEWEWVSCEGYEGVSDGPASLFVKAGSGEWWSLVQVRNGPGAVSELRIRKTGTEQWKSLPWATEAENFFSLPAAMLQDSDDWDVEVVWETGSTGSLRLAGKKLAVEEASYQLQ